MSLSLDMPTKVNALIRHQNIMYLVGEIKRNFIQLGEQLYAMDKYKDYKALDYVSFNAYLASPEIDIGRSTAYKLKGIYETYIVDLECNPVQLLDCSAAKLEIIRPHVTEKNLPELLPQAQTLSRSDLRKEMRRQFGKQNGHDSLLNRLKMLKSMSWDILELEMNPIVRGLLEQVYKLLDKVLESYLSGN